MSTLLRLSCPDRVGLLALISNFVAQHGGNLIEVHQYTDAAAGWFFTRMEIDSRTLALDLPTLRESFTPLAGKIDAEWTIRPSSGRRKVVVLVSQLGHCLADLLWRWHSGELDFELAAVISNHENLRPMVEREGLEFCHVPVDLQDKPSAFARLAEIFRFIQPDLIILARYMQIIPSEICAEFSGRIINIHHSFLPSFVGANPYLRAWQRGVKLIGATCHYVTPELDAGPIIDQEVIRVEHFHSPDDLIRLGRDCERLALARSVRWHLADRVLLRGQRAIVFRD